MAKNPPSPEVYNKLIKCCKYFWLKNPVITLNSLGRTIREKYWKTNKMNGFRNCQKLQTENMVEKLWIHNQVSISNKENQFMASTIIPKIYRCDLTHLSLSFQSLSFNEFKLFTSSGSLETLRLHKTSVKNDDGSIVPIEKLIELSPKLQSFDCHSVSTVEGGLQTITSETAAKLVALPHFPQMKRFYFFGVPELFDIEAFFATPKVSAFFDCLLIA